MKTNSWSSKEEKRKICIPIKLMCSGRKVETFTWNIMIALHIGKIQKLSTREMSSIGENGNQIFGKVRSFLFSQNVLPHKWNGTFFFKLLPAVRIFREVEFGSCRSCSFSCCFRVARMSSRLRPIWWSSTFSRSRTMTSSRWRTSSAS